MSRQQLETISIGAVPRADLLPPAARDAIRRRPIVRRLIIGVVAVALVVLLAVAAATVYAITAQALLQAERDRSETLLAQQLEFAEARAIDATITEITGSRAAATAAEIDWQALLTQVRQTLPPGVQIVSVEGILTTPELIGLPPSSAAAGGEGAEEQPLRQDSVASIRISATSPTVPDVESWFDDLEGVQGFAGIAPPTSVLGSEGSVYAVTIEFLLSEEAFLGRYAADATEGEN